MKKNLIKGALYVLAAIALGYIIITTDWRDVYIHIRSISPNIIVLLLLSQCLTMLLLALQWRSMALRVKRGVSYRDILMVNAKGNIVDSITPGVKAGGELARVYELRKRLSIDFGEATIIVGLQKTLSLISFLFLTLLSLLWFSFKMGTQFRYHLYIFSAVIAVFSIFMGALILFSLKPDFIIRLLNKIFGKYQFMPKIDKTLKDYSSIIKDLLKDKKKLLAQMLLAIFIWCFYAFKLLLVMKGFAIEMDYMSVAAITFLTYIAGMVPMLPGSIGSFESSMLILLAIRGIPMEIGLSVAFIFRFITFWFEFILSFFILGLDNILVYTRKGDNNVGVKME